MSGKYDGLNDSELMAILNHKRDQLKNARAMRVDPSFSEQLDYIMDYCADIKAVVEVMRKRI